MSSSLNVIPQPHPKIAEWVHRFRYYREPPTANSIQEWLGLFDNDDLPLAEKVLDHITILSEGDIHRGYRTALDSLPGWDKDAAKRTGRWFFVGFGKAGESGPAMVRLFREANDLALQRYDNLFCSLSDLPGLKLTAFDVVVFIDDFAGSGRQVCTMWPIVQELIASEASCYLVLTAITDKAETQIRENTSLSLTYKLRLERQDDVFSDESTLFDEAERTKLLAYGRRADSRNPKGFGNCGLLFVLSHKTPNNSLPILHVNEERWRGLFPRYLRAV